MSTILLTGASGFLGSALLEKLSTEHQVVTIGRKALDTAENQVHYKGLFSEFEDLRQLDAHAIDAVVHLAAVTGGCLERDGMLVNVEGTRVLMRYLVDRGCRKFVLASSTAVVGFEDPAFQPLQVPIPDEHPCLDRHGYGLSKYLMEELTRYYHRQNPQIDVINLRLAAIGSDEDMPPKAELGPAGPWAVGSLTMMKRSEAVRALCMAVEAPAKPGVRIMNIVPGNAWTSVPTAAMLSHWWGDAVDLACYRQPGHEYASVFDTRRSESELGFATE